MAIQVLCACGKKLAAREELAGKRAKCPQCGKTLLIPPVAATSKTPAATAPAGPLYDGKLAAHWLDLLASADPADRRKAADVLAGVGPEAVADIETFVSRSTSEHVLVRHWATVCLGAVGPGAKEAVPALLARLNDDQPLVREKAAHSIEQVLPDARHFVRHLLLALNEKDDDRRAAAIELFRRNLQTGGVSRFRFWACTCSRVYIKLDLEQRLRQMVDSPESINWDGKRVCGQCGAQYDDREIYAGKYDVPEVHWPKLVSKFGKHLSVPLDFLADAKQDEGYRISDESQGHDPLIGMPLLEPFSLAMAGPASLETDQGYAIAEAASPPPVYGVLGQKRESSTAQELVPGTLVQVTGKYKCITCGKKRLASAAAAPTAPRASVVMPFKAGKTFTECPQCGELTEWELLPSSPGI